MENILYRLVTALALILYTQGAIYSNLWAVQIKGGERNARSVAEQNGFTYVEKVNLRHYVPCLSLSLLFYQLMRHMTYNVRCLLNVRR